MTKIIPMSDFKPISGAGGGGKGGGGEGGGAHEAPNTLQSNAVAKFVDLLCEGEIEGLVDGAKSIYLDKVPVLNPDGSPNFKGFTFYFQTGLEDQGSMPNFDNITSEFPVALRVRNDTPIAYQTQTDGLTAVIVTLEIPALTKTDTTTGDINGYNVSIAIDIRDESDPANEWVTPVSSDFISGKNTSPYERSYRLGLQGTGPWLVRMRRLSPDNDNDVTIQDKTYFSRITEVIEHKVAYADSAVVGIQIDAQQFGTNIPSRAYEIYGLKMRYPSNYDPNTRTYSGFWDGTWSYGYQNNPAWAFMALLTNPRFGVGLADQYVDKWGLYAIAQYCDELVNDGFGGQEPRFVFNGVITNPDDAYKVLQSIASMMRAVIFYANGAIIARQDKPKTPVKLFTQANIVGDFQYSSTAKKVRHTVAQVSYINPDIGYQTDYEIYEDTDSIIKYGYNPIAIVSFGTTSRGQAFRLGKWAVLTDQLQTETVQFTTGLDAGDVLPGDLIEIADPSWATADFGGRILGSTTTTVTLDRPIDFAGSTSPEIHLTLLVGDVDDFADEDNTGRVAAREVTYFSSAVIGYDPDTYTVTLATPLSSEQVPGAQPVVWIFSKEELKPRVFQVLSLDEDDNNELQIHVVGIEYDASKFPRVDEDERIRIVGDTFSNLPSVGYVDPPTNLIVNGQTFFQNGVLMLGANLSWTASPNQFVAGYLVSYKRNDDNWVFLPQTLDTSLSLSGLSPGSYVFNVRAVNRFGIKSTAIAATLDLAGSSAAGKYLVTDIVSITGGNTFEGPDCHIVWTSQPIVHTQTQARVTTRVVRPFVGTLDLITVDETTPTAPTMTCDGPFLENDQIEITIGSDLFFYVVPASPTNDSVATGIAGVIDPFAAYTAAAAANVVTIGFNGQNLATDVSAMQDPYFKRFVVTVKDQTDNVLRTEYTTTASYIYNFEKNLQDTGGAPKRGLRFSIEVEDIRGGLSNPGTADISNPPPAPQTPTIVMKAFETIMQFQKPIDPDYAGIVVWLSASDPAFTPSDANRVWNSTSNPIIPTEAGATYYVKWAIYDQFGLNGVTVSDPATIDAALIDATAFVADLRTTVEDAAALLATIHDIETSAGEDLNSILLDTSLANNVAALAEQNLLDRNLLDERTITIDGKKIISAFDQYVTTQSSTNDTFVSQITTILASIDNANAAIVQETGARVTADEAMTTSITLMQSTMDGFTASLTTEQTTRADADSAFTELFTLLGAKSSDGTAFILDQDTVKVSSTESLAQRLAGITSSFGDVNASIASEASTRATNDGALAAQLSTVSTTVDGHTASVTTLETSVDGLMAKYSLALDVNGYVVGWIFNNNGTTGDLTIVTDVLRIVDPGSGTAQQVFLYSGGIFKMTNIEVDTIKANTITANHIVGGAVTNTLLTTNNVDTSFSNAAEVTVLDFYFTNEAGGPTDLMINIEFYNPDGSNDHGEAVYIYRDGVSLGSKQYAVRAGYTQDTVCPMFDNPGIGTFHYTVTVKCEQAATQHSLYAYCRTIEYKR